MKKMLQLLGIYIILLLATEKFSFAQGLLSQEFDKKARKSQHLRISNSLDSISERAKQNINREVLRSKKIIERSLDDHRVKVQQVLEDIKMKAKEAKNSLQRMHILCQLPDLDMRSFAEDGDRPAYIDTFQRMPPSPRDSLRETF